MVSFTATTHKNRKLRLGRWSVVSAMLLELQVQDERHARERQAPCYGSESRLPPLEQQNRIALSGRREADDAHPGFGGDGPDGRDARLRPRAAPRPLPQPCGGGRFQAL